MENNDVSSVSVVPHNAASDDAERRAFYPHLNQFTLRGSAEHIAYLEKRISFLEEVVFDLYQRSK